jgi:protein-S-isoprenylcysteine O-methyltransferase Ste14
MSNRLKSSTLVAVQFACLIALALTGPLVARQPLALALQVAGGLLGVWAAVAMRVGNFNISPEVRRDSVLVAAGPYRWIRHPMYLAVLMVAAALVADHFTLLRAGIGLVLAVDLLVKLRFEERLLVAHHPEYAAYAQRTARLIPFIY